MRDLVPLKIKIGRWGKETLDAKKRGKYKYPDFDGLQAVKDSGLSWEVYNDVFGSGWIYDRVDHNEDDGGESPFGTKLGIMIVPKDFADEAVTMFPDVVSKLTEVELETFYTSRISPHQSEIKVDESIMKYYDVVEKVKKVLTEDEIEKRDKALDPNDPEPGATNNPRKTWQRLKAKKGINIVS